MVAVLLHVRSDVGIMELYITLYESYDMYETFQKVYDIVAYIRLSFLWTFGHQKWYRILISSTQIRSYTIKTFGAFTWVISFVLARILRIQSKESLYDPFCCSIRDNSLSIKSPYSYCNYSRYVCCYWLSDMWSMVLRFSYMQLYTKWIGSHTTMILSEVFHKPSRPKVSKY